MSLRHFKRLNCTTATNSTKTSDKEVRIITTCSNTDNDILNNMKTSETAVETVATVILFLILLYLMILYLMIKLIYHKR